MWKPTFNFAQPLKSLMMPALPVLISTLFILCQIAIWWIGPELDLNGYKPLVTPFARGMASLLVGLMTLSGWGVWQWRKLQRMQAQQQRETQEQIDPFAIEEERQTLALNHAMNELTQTLNTPKALYARPWYMVLGADNAGKTSFIERTLQHTLLPSIPNYVEEAGRENPHHIGWWLGNDSVLIEPKGQLMVQRQKKGRGIDDPSWYGSELGTSETENTDTSAELARRLWCHLLRWLSDTRHRRPLNGILLVVDLSFLTTASIREQNAAARLIRTRVRELIQALDTRLPLYVTFTKLDLLYGFEPFFRHSTKAQREDVLGFTFPLETSDTPERWLAEFTKQYAQFIARIQAAFPHVVERLTVQEDRDAVYSFVQQLTGLQGAIHAFLQEALWRDHASTSAQVRGAYFTSVYQQGVPTNAFDEAASHRYQLTPSANRAYTERHPKLYFAQNLLNRIVYPEMGLATDSARSLQKKRRIIGLSLAVCTVASVLMLVTWQRYYRLNVEHADIVLAQVDAYQMDHPTGIKNTSLRGVLQPLNQMREATLAFGLFHDKPRYVSDFGLYQGHAIGNKVETTYLSLLEQRFLPLLMSDLIMAIQQADNDEDQLALLRVYRMLVDNSGRRNNVVLDYFSQIWHHTFVGETRVQSELIEHLDYALRHTDLVAARARGESDAEQVLQPYEQTIARIQQKLSALPSDQRLYRNLKMEAQPLLGEALDIRHHVGAVFDDVFTQRSTDKPLHVPQMFTRTGFERYFVPHSESMSELSQIDRWALGEIASTQFSATEQQTLQNNIRDLYVADYVTEWRSVLDNIDIRHFRDLNEAVMVLDNLTGSREPLQRLWRTLSDNTQMLSVIESSNENSLISTDIVNRAGGLNDKERLGRIASYVHDDDTRHGIAASIQTAFNAEQKLLQSQDDQPAYMQDVIAAVSDVQEYLEAMNNAPDVGMAALEATKARMKLVKSDPIYTLQRIATGLPPSLQRMMNQIADESWMVVKKEALRYLNIRWQADVYQPYYAKLAVRYPLNRQANKDISLDDFEAFFAPNGILDGFYQHHLAVFIDNHLSVEKEGRMQPVISHELLSQFQYAEQIRQAFFNRRGILEVNFAVEPHQLSGNKRRSVLNIDGQLLTYSHGPRNRVELIWPNTLRESAVSKVTLVPTQVGHSPRTLQTTGAWALFHLLDQGDASAASATSVDYQFTVDGGNMVYRVSADSSVNPFTDRLFKSFHLPDRLY